MENTFTHQLVVAVALRRADGSVLMQRRRFGAVHGGLWEFPGGKVEAGETPEDAAVREIAEELDVAIDPARLLPVSFAGGAAGGPDARIVILLYSCACWRGEPHCCDGEAIDWYRLDQLAGLAMPPLDYPLAEALVALAGAEVCSRP